MLKLKRNILNFGYGVKFRYEGKLSHSFDRFYIVTKFELPKIEDLHLTAVHFDSKYYLDMGKDKNNLLSSSYLPKLLAYCEKIVPFVEFYKKPVAYYNRITYEVLSNVIDLILPKFKGDKRNKRGIISSVISGVIGFTYKGISSFLHHKRQNSLHKAVKAMERKADIQCNNFFL